MHKLLGSFVVFLCLFQSLFIFIGCSNTPDKVESGLAEEALDMSDLSHEEKLAAQEEIIRRQEEEIKRQQRELEDLKRQKFYNRSMQRFEKE